MIFFSSTYSQKYYKRRELDHQLKKNEQVWEFFNCFYGFYEMDFVVWDRIKILMDEEGQRFELHE